MMNITSTQRKIIHVDMDCFFVAIEIRDNPTLKGKPVAVGGTPTQRGVLATCNYEARKYGLHSAMPTAQALKLCPHLILLSVDMPKYRAVSQKLYRIFCQYTSQVEMLSLDEAFLDVSNCHLFKGSATLIAQAIKQQIQQELRLSSSAGVAPNKFLAKVASDWQKPNGLFVITPQQVASFIKKLPITKIFGVGVVTARKLHKMHIKTCGDLQEIPQTRLIEIFGKRGISFDQFCRGIDERPVEPEFIRKSLSVETTFPQDIKNDDEYLRALHILIQKIKKRLITYSNLPITKQFIKIKFNNFKTTTVEKKTNTLNTNFFHELLQTGTKRHNKPVRLIGVGVRFNNQP